MRVRYYTKKYLIMSSKGNQSWGANTIKKAQTWIDEQKYIQPKEKYTIVENTENIKFSKIQIFR